MKLSKQQRDEMAKAAEPLAKWLDDNCHPHISAVVTSTQIELLEGLATSFLLTRAAEGKDLRTARTL